MNARDARLAFALLKVRAGQIAAALKAVAPHLDQEPGDRNSAKLGGVTLGKVGKTEPELKAVIVGPSAFLDYVRANAPTEVETIVRVRPAYADRLMSELTRRGRAVDEDGQEVPGVDFRASAEPSQRFYPAAGAAEALAAARPEDLPQVDGVDLPGLLGIGGDGA